MADAQEYGKLLTEMRQIALYGAMGAILDWDERTQMPPRGAQLRADQSALLAGMVHQRFTAPQIGADLAAVEDSALAADPANDAAVNAREIRRDYDRARKLPQTLVQEIAHTAVLGQQAWVEARKKSDFAAFAPWLEKMLGLKRQEAACYGFQGVAYDALLEGYEPGETAAYLTQVFTSLRSPLVELVGKIAASKRRAPVEILRRHYPAQAQARLARAAAQAIGFDFEAGRIDVTVHPFCSTIGPGDTRLTTRYDEHYFNDGFFGTLHETGHGLYGQGLDDAHFGMPLGQAVSLGIHESQSRLWENLVGRGRPFWTGFLPKVRAAFPEALAGVSDDDWHAAINSVQPSFIRTEADEATYNLHVLLRFELEQALMADELAVADLPDAWNAKMRQYLGLTPTDAARGCLQDVHWSAGLIGYFPTYTLGNMYAAQFFSQAGRDLGDLDGQLARGELAPLLKWLRENIHRHGKRYSAGQLVQRITGQPLGPAALLEHLRSNAGELYGV